MHTDRPAGRELLETLRTTRARKAEALRKNRALLHSVLADPAIRREQVGPELRRHFLRAGVDRSWELTVRPTVRALRQEALLFLHWSREPIADQTMDDGYARCGAEDAEGDAKHYGYLHAIACASAAAILEDERARW